MPTDFIPSREGDAVSWFKNFGAKIAVAPGDVGLTPAQELAYASELSAFIAAFDAANDPATRTPMSVALKDDHRKAIEAMAREYARIINAVPGMTNPVRISLGLTPRTEEHVPTPAPAYAPSVDVEEVTGTTIHLRLHDSETGRRAKPEGVVSATILYAVSEQPPVEAAAWLLGATVSRTSVSLTLPESSPRGARVWIRAFWSNRRQERSPMSPAIGTNLQNNGAMAA